MTNKRGEETRQLIKKSACSLFAGKGFKQVTMKDICEAANLSRGGLYCHYGSTREIFREIINNFMIQQGDSFSEKIEHQLSAKEILNEVLEKYKNEMLDSQSSLSLALYEYFSIDNTETGNELCAQYTASFNAWQTLLEYGIKNGEFHHVDIKSVFDLIIFSYQGVRMYSKIMPIDEDIPQRIIDQIKKIIVKE
ncbi:MAG TPA: TetR/AcrR family transcriptional regulator [Candidatus Mediterraneibacter vanvlietii]|nr:TetR/AcrR family transcriptional regulator [Candidatus Mediterraneibacter vanvlietii]